MRKRNPSMTFNVTESMPIHRDVVIEEYFSKDHNIVYQHWRFANQKKWHKVKTAYKEIPVVKINW